MLFEFIDRGLFEPNLELRLPRAPRLGATRCSRRSTAEFPEGSSWSQPDGGYFLWVDLPAGVKAESLFARADQAGVQFVKGSDFFVDEGGEEAHAARVQLRLGGRDPTRASAGSPGSSATPPQSPPKGQSRRLGRLRPRNQRRRRRRVSEPAWSAAAGGGAVTSFDRRGAEVGQGLVERSDRDDLRVRPRTDGPRWRSRPGRGTGRRRLPWRRSSSA